MAQVFFLRGLSTKGGDDIRFAFLNWGMMYSHLVRDLKPHDVHVHPIIGMGGGDFLDQARKAIQFLREHDVWKQSSEPVHLLGHSAGGLLARMMVQLMTPEELKRIASIVTIATPHKGSKLAALCLTAPDEHPWFAGFLRRIGYDVRRGAVYYRQLTPEFVEQSMREWRAPENIKLASVVCSAEKKSWPFQVARILPTMRKISGPSDGLLELESQTFGQVLDHFNLDHLCQLGVYQKPEFHRMCETLARYFKSF